MRKVKQKLMRFERTNTAAVKAAVRYSSNEKYVQKSLFVHIIIEICLKFVYNNRWYL